MILIRLLPGLSKSGRPILIPIADEIEVTAPHEINGYALTVEVDEKDLKIQRGWDSPHGKGEK